MTIHFYINYHTSFADELVICLRKDDEEKFAEHKMRADDAEHWTFRLNTDLPAKVYEYYYAVRRGPRIVRTEWRTITHRIETAAAKRYFIYDSWAQIPEDSYLYSSAFTDCINRQHVASTADTVKALHETGSSRSVRLIVRAPQLRRDEKLFITGSAAALGQWDVEKALPMTLHNYNEWLIQINLDSLADCGGGLGEFKFIAKGTQGILWETGPNRQLAEPAAHKPAETAIYTLDQAFFAICNRKFSGTLVPVFSLRTKQSQGIGDFGDLCRMIELTARCGQNVLQLLPVNDTTITHTWTDSYPYSCISVFALHPQYANLRALPQLKDKADREWAETTAAELNALKQIDYERVNDFKTAYLRKLYAQEGPKTMRTAAYKKFFCQTEQWIVPYASYSALRDKYHTADFTQWPDHNQWNEADRQQLTNPRCQAYKEAAFFYYVQYILYVQMTEAHNLARQLGVVLKGDIPIGVNRCSCDVWTEPRYFNLNGQAGAPPDDFSVNGQNWGFPTYNWEAMLADGCAWWTRRFQNMQNFFDAYRIDHVLGFFRIWEIPVNSVHGLLGQFAPALGMSREEIAGYGLNFQEDRFLQPFITDWTLDRLVGERAAEVKDRFLEPLDGERYRLKPQYDTQRKVEAAFKDATDPADISLRDAIYSMISCVLFLRDNNNPKLFHPRITAQSDFIYESLYDVDKYAFNRLYNDYFYCRMNHFWYREAMKKLPNLIEATRMLVCAEDLGMVPDCVPWVMGELKILSLELQSMPKETGVRFGRLESYPYRSVTTISSHDMPTLRMWWDEDEDRAQAYYNDVLGHEGTAPHPMPAWLAQDVISRHLDSPSMLCILSIQDWLAMFDRLRLPDASAERINIPANPKHYWRYRMHVDINSLAADPEYTGTLRTLQAPLRGGM